ncbi:KEOPS complex subunit Pcc1, partial [Halorubrum pallidum]
VVADDLVALRAGINSWSRLVAVAERVSTSRAQHGSVSPPSDTDLSGDVPGDDEPSGDDPSNYAERD